MGRSSRSVGFLELLACRDGVVAAFDERAVRGWVVALFWPLVVAGPCGVACAGGLRGCGEFSLRSRGDLSLALGDLCSYALRCRVALGGLLIQSGFGLLAGGVQPFRQVRCLLSRDPVDCGDLVLDVRAHGEDGQACDDDSLYQVFCHA